MKKYLYCLFAALIAATAYADGPFIPGQVLTANQLNSALATKTNNASAAITGGTINGATVGITTPATGKFTTLTVNTANPAINYQSSATGSTPRGLANKLGDEVNLLDFAGCDATGVTDSSTCVQNAVNSLSGGGRVKAIGKFLLNSNLTIPVGVTLEGDCVMPGTPGNNVSAPYDIYKCGVIKLNSSATITLNSGASLKSLLIYRAGMTFPAPDSSGFAGTAVTITGDDSSVISSMILGFNKAVYKSGGQRARIQYLYGDNNNGIEITNSGDIDYITNCHMWPFATMGGPGDARRSGTAYYFHDFVDWAKITDSFSWGYYRGLHINNANSITVLNSGFDNAFSGGVPIHTGSMGIVIEGEAYETKLIGVQTAAQQTAGIYINTNPGLATLISGHTAWGGSTHGVWVNAGDAIISGSTYRGIANGITETNAASRVTVTANRFQQISGTPINPSTATSLVFLDDNDFGDFTGTVGSSSMTAQSVASADPINLPRSGNVFSVTGTTSFGTLSGGWVGRTVTLVFGGSLSVFNGSGVNNMALKDGSNFATSTNSSLTLTFDGSKWVESGRSQTMANPYSVTTLSASGQITSTVATGTAPFVVSSTTPVANLSVGGNAATVTGLSVTAGKTLTASNSLTFAGTDGSTLNVGTGGTLGSAAYTASTAYLAAGGTAANSSQLLGATWAAPGTIGSTTPATGAFTSISGTLWAAIGYTPSDTTFGTAKTNGGSGGGAMGFRAIETVGSGVTTSYTSFDSIPSTAAASFTLGSLQHFYAHDLLTQGAGSTISTQFGYRAANMTKATTNYGFVSEMTSGSNKWGFYGSGNANNAFAGNTRFGGTTAPVATVDVTGSISHTQQEIDLSYTYNTPTTGQTVTIASGTQTAIINPAGTLAALTITLPACNSGYDGSLVRYTSEQVITALTVNASSGSVSGAPTNLAIGAGNGYICRGSNTTWYRLY